jgi:hypothetical protein
VLLAVPVVVLEVVPVIEPLFVVEVVPIVRLVLVVRVVMMVKVRVVVLVAMFEVILVVVLLVVVAVRVLAIAGAVIDTFVEVLAGDMRVDALIIVFNVAVDSLLDTFAVITRGVLTNIGLSGLTDVNVNVFEDVMAAFDFSIAGPLEGFRC